MKEIIVLIVTVVLVWVLKFAIGFDYNIFVGQFDLVQALVNFSLFLAVYFAVSWVVERISALDMEFDKRKQ